MSTKRIIGIIIAACGAFMLVFSNYISKQVQEGRGKISRAQSQVDTGNKLFSINPITKEVGKGISGGAQRRIDAGSMEADEYAVLAHQLQIGGVVLLIVGCGIVFLSSRKKR